MFSLTVRCAVATLTGGPVDEPGSSPKFRTAIANVHKRSGDHSRAWRALPCLSAVKLALPEPHWRRPVRVGDARLTANKQGDAHKARKYSLWTLVSAGIFHLCSRCWPLFRRRGRRFRSGRQFSRVPRIFGSWHTARHGRPFLHRAKTWTAVGQSPAMTRDSRSSDFGYWRQMA